MKSVDMMKRINTILLATLIATGLWAVPATPYPIDITLADGTTTQVYLRGDEYGHHYTLLDGTPVRLEQGKLITDYTLPEITRQKMHIARQTAIQASDFPNTGSPRGLIILVNFKDKKFIKTNEQFKALLNEAGYSENGGIGSARDYFIGASDSLFQPIFDVYGPYDLPQNMAYYGAPSGRGHDSRPDEMVMHACAAAEENGVDFSLYDENNDGKIDNVFVYYAGNNQAEGAEANTIWPHRSAIPSRPQYGGKTLYDYACSSELRGAASKKMCGIGTFCHEFSHVLGLADLYDTSGNNVTVDYWDLMASGSYNGNGCQPPSYTAFERFSVGWLTPTVLSDPGQYLLEPLTTHNQAYLIPVSDKKIEPNENGEYFLLENRQKVGWDAGSSCLKGTGMLVWHINYKASAWAQNRPNAGDNLLCFIESARGFTRTQGSSYDPFPGKGKKTIFKPTSVNGVSLEKPLLDIKQLDNTIAFVYIRDGNKHLTFDQSEPLIFDGNYTVFADGLYEEDVPMHLVTLTGESLNPNEVVTIHASSNHFRFKVNNGIWTNRAELKPNADSTFNATIYIEYMPMQQVCNYTTAYIQAIQGAALAVVEMKGRAPRKTIITEPQNCEETLITPYSAELTWPAIPDATHYYLSLYQIHDGAMAFEQGFESTEIINGWDMQTCEQSTLLKEAGSYSLWLRDSGAYVISEEYAYPPSSIRFWYGAPTSEIDTVGVLSITATDGTTSELIEEITIRKRDRKKVYETVFDSPKYTRFTLSFTPAAEQSQGVCIDNFTAVCDKQITFLYQADELTIEAIDGEESVKCYISSLQPSSKYFYKIRVSDKGRGGCSENIKEMADARSFTTLDGNDGELDLGYGLENMQTNPIHVIYLPEPQTNAVLYFYDTMGRLVATTPVADGQTRVEFPEGNFIRGNIYIVKCATADSMKRKDRRVKIIY